MSSEPMQSREIRLRSRPAALPTADDFELATVVVEPPGRDELRVRNLWMSVDPYMRGRMNDRKSYVPPFEIGAPLQGAAIGEVVDSSVADFHVGDLVQSMFGWREMFNARTSMVQKLPPIGLPPESYLGVAGPPGLTAYVGMLEIARVKPGDVVFVSGAAGAVGSAAAQIAKIQGARVIGSAGGPEKCAFLRDVGLDAVIDYKSQLDTTVELKRLAPDGIDVYFDNVGGEQLDAALACAKTFARFALCGMISQYNATDAYRPANIGLTVGKSLRLEGFIVSNYFHLMPAFLESMAGWIRDGRVRWQQTVETGIAKAPDAFLKLFSGGNTGKMLVRLG